MNCPKCGAFLFRIENKKNRYYCIGCSLSGTFEEMKKQIPAINKIYRETLSKVTCKLCGRLEIMQKILLVSIPNIGSFYICLDCKKNKNWKTKIIKSII